MTVGGGGAGGSGGNSGSAGNSSSFYSMVAAGGGGGSSSAGGASGSGNAGGSAGGTNPYYTAGGGGGSSGVGGNGGSSNGGNGGAGTSSSVSGSAQVYGGGGGGGCSGSGSCTSPGTGQGGGGNGGNFGGSSGSAGAANTGGGGGGAGGGNGGGAGGAGGSGVVVVSYPTGSLTATGGTITTVGSTTIHTFTSNGAFTVTQTATTSTTTVIVSPNKVQDFTYTYDPVGNITQLTNNATTTNSASVTYQYDALNRLISATTISAVSSPYAQVFSYDPLGNILAITTDTSTSSSTPTIIATSTDRAPGLSISDSFAFNAGATSSNTLLLLAFEGSGGVPTSATYNGQSLTLHSWTGQVGSDALGYLVNPTPGSHTFSISYPNQSQPLYRLLVLNNINQATPVDTDGATTSSATSSCSKTLTTTANDLLFASTIKSSSNNLAYWKFDESSGNASDATGNGYTLTNNNSVSFSAGKINNAAVFASANSKYFSKSSASGLVPSSAITVAAWVYLASNNGEAIVSKGNLGTYAGPYAFAINVINGLSFYSSNGSSAGWAGGQLDAEP